MRIQHAIFASLALVSFGASTPSVRADDRPNIFLAIADDWGYPYAGALWRSGREDTDV